MTKEELINDLEKFLNDHEQVESAGRITGEHAIGIELLDGTGYFITIDEA